ncbi:MAG: EAL domain-containing protein [Betaproteobacteria bacterium]|nr:EAL domain-containing protein [Betaproteobacteria bacterium]
MIVATLPAFAIMSAHLVWMRDERIGQSLLETRLRAENIAERYQTLMARTRDVLMVLARSTALLGRASAQVCEKYLAPIVRSDPSYANMGVVGPDGALLCSVVPAKQGTSFADRTWFREAIGSGGFAIGELVTGRIIGKPTVVVAYPISDAATRIGGVIYASLNLDWLRRLLEAPNLAGRFGALVLDAKGTVVASSSGERARVGTSVSRALLFKALVSQDGKGSAQTIGLRGQPAFAGFAVLGDLESGRLFVVVTEEKAAVLSKVNRRFEWDLGAMTASALLVLGLAGWLSGPLFVRRLRAVIDAAGRLAGGDLGARTDLVPNRDELGRLAGAFDGMAKSLELRDRAFKTLSAGNRAVLRATDEGDLLESMCRVAIEIGGYRMAWVGYLQHDEARTVRPVAHAGADEGFLRSITVTWGDDPFGQGPTGEAIRSGTPQVSRSVREDPALAPWLDAVTRHGILSIIALPLTVEGERLGNFTIYASEPDAFDREEVRLLSETAADLSYGIGALRTKAREQEASKTVTRLAYHDALTGLPNRAQFLERLAVDIATAMRDNRPLAVLVVSLENLRDVDEGLGYRPGDEFLKGVGQRLSRAVGGHVSIARLTEDRFALCVPNEDAGGAMEAADRILAALGEPVRLSGITLDVSVIVGIALYPGHGVDADILIRRADEAIRQARRAGSTAAVYMGRAGQDTAQQLWLSGELRGAIDNGQLQLHYQPKVDLKSRRPCGAEALVRWTHHERGAISPGEFIPLAERTGLIKAVTDWVMQATVRQARAWGEVGFTLPLAVNLSARNLRDPTLASRLQGLLTTWGVSPERLEFEITESAVMDDQVYALRVLTQIHEMGIRLFIDDFGTGYSSLRYLQKLPVDAIKIDQSFVSAMSKDPDSAKIVKSTIDLAHDLGLKVVAEGVEDAVLEARLAQLGCDIAQGYFYAKPLPAEKLIDWCRQRGADRDPLEV